MDWKRDSLSYRDEMNSLSVIIQSMSQRKERKDQEKMDNELLPFLN